MLEIWKKVKVLVAQLFPTLCHPMDCSPPGSSIHGIFQARVLEWGAIAFSDDKPNSVLKSRDISLPTKAHVVKAMVFPLPLASLLFSAICKAFSDNHFAFCITFSCFLDRYDDFSEKAMAPHSSTLAWEIPWMEDPGGLQSTGSRRVRHDWATSLSLFTFMHWRRKWQPTPVFLPGESQGQWSLVGCRLWDRRVGHDQSDLAAAIW